MAKNTLPIIIGAVLFGLLALGLTFNALLGGGGNAPAPTTATQEAAQPAEPEKVFVARRPIYPRTVITRDMIEESESATNTPNAITNAYDVVGRIANGIIQPGQVLTTDSVTSTLGRVIPANIPIPAGLRGVAVWVDPDQTAAGLVDIGDRVDVIATHELKIEKTGGQYVIGATEYTAGRTIAQDLEVLAVDRSIQAARPANPAPGEQDQQQQQQGNVAQPTGNTPAAGQNRTRLILAAAPDIAQRLVAANSKGQLHITIRNPGTRDRFPVAEAREYPSRVAVAPSTGTSTANRRSGGGGGGGGNVTFEPIFPSGPSMPPAALPPFNPNGPDVSGIPAFPAGKDVTVIRGTEKSQVTVPR